MEPPTWITCIFNCAPITYFDNPITRFVDRINTAQIVNKKLPANLAGESYCHCRVYQRKTVRCGVFICSVAAKADTPKHAFKLHDFITSSMQEEKQAAIEVYVD